jgi:type I restriction enzyme S subunit
MSDVPVGWAESSVGELFALDSGTAPSAFRAGDLSGPVQVYGANGPIGSTQTDNFGPGYLVGRVGAVGSITRVQKRVWASDNTLTVTPRANRCDDRFAEHLLRFLNLARLSTMTAQPLITHSNLAKLTASVPMDTIEQSRIGAVLDTVDEAIAKTEAVIAKLKQVRAGLVHDLLTRGLDENGQLRDPIAHPEQFQDSPLGRIPTGWHYSKFDDVLEGIDAGKSPDYPDQPAPAGEWGVLKVSAIWPEGFRPQENKWVTKAMHQIPAFQVRDGDLLISRSNTYELVGLVSFVSDAPPRLMLCDKTLRLRLKRNRGLNLFFLFLLQTSIARRQVEVNATGTSGSMKNISQDVIRALQLPYPEIQEQERILAAIAPISSEVEALEQELTKLVALKSGLMNDLLTGRVRVPAGITVTR